MKKSDLLVSVTDNVSDDDLYDLNPETLEAIEERYNYLIEEYEDEETNEYRKHF